MTTGAALRPTVKPHITGKAKVGRRLAVTTGTWSPAATTYRVTWMVGERIVGTGRTLKVVRAYRGKAVKVVVVASSPGYENGTARAKVRVKR